MFSHDLINQLIGVREKLNKLQLRHEAAVRFHVEHELENDLDWKRWKKEEDRLIEKIRNYRPATRTQ